MNTSGIISQNRAEEFGYDVWEHFVIPPFFDRLDLLTARKPRKIIGGRGCGKTMLLRFLSHQSMFSVKRSDIPNESLSHIGLYWRVDTQFSSIMIKRGIEDDVWESSFNHLAALLIGQEVLKSLQSIAASKSSLLSDAEINQIDFSRLRVMDTEFPNSLQEAKRHLENKVWEFESWVNDVRKRSCPDFLPGTKFILAIISLIRDQIASLSNANFFVYMDEFENLLPYQQAIINTWLKHSEMPLIFNIAMKRSEFKLRNTTGNEVVSDIHDFRQHDLEAYYLEDNSFEIFAAEIIFLMLSKSGYSDLPMNPHDLQDIRKLSERRNTAYKKGVLSKILSIFPGQTQKELAAGVFKEKIVKDKLFEKIQKALKKRNSNIDPESFLSSEYPEATIVCPALLNRKSIQPNELLTEYEKHTSGLKSNFSNSKDWIHNNFIGCLLQLYEPLPRPCPVYAGFDTFCTMSRGNIRYLLELCNKSMSRFEYEGGGIGLAIPTEQQAESARQASAAFLGEIKSFGKLGNKLHAFVLRLGLLFKRAHQRPSQSEPEQNHFSISGIGKNLSEYDEEFLEEAIKRSVLFVEKSTKNKATHEEESPEYVLNPIYAPYFHISYRKRRKMSLTTDQVITIIRGGVDEFETLIKSFSTKWQLDFENAPSLFSASNEL